MLEDLLRHQESPRMIFDTTRLHKALFQKVNFLKNLKILRKHEKVHHQRSHSEPGVDIVGIYVENHEGVCRECFIWMRFDFCSLDF